jgi:hypothetical protein
LLDARTAVGWVQRRGTSTEAQSSSSSSSIALLLPRNHHHMALRSTILALPTRFSPLAIRPAYHQAPRLPTARLHLRPFAAAAALQLRSMSSAAQQVPKTQKVLLVSRLRQNRLQAASLLRLTLKSWSPCRLRSRRASKRFSRRRFRCRPSRPARSSCQSPLSSSCFSGCSCSDLAAAIDPSTARSPMPASTSA